MRIKPKIVAPTTLWYVLILLNRTIQLIKARNKKVTYIEVYNERVKDLLSSAIGKFALEAACDLSIREDREKGFYVEGVTECEVKNYEELIAVFKRGEQRR